MTTTREYYIVLDSAPPSPVYALMIGDKETAIGTEWKQGKTIKELLRRVPKDTACFRVYLQRTDGKTGYKRIK